MRREYDIAFVPDGEMNTALAVNASRNGHKVTIFFHQQESLKYFLETNESNRKKLEGIKLTGVIGTTDLEEALAGRDILVFTPRSQDLRDYARQAAPFYRTQKMVVCTKGIDEHEGKFHTSSRVVEQEIPAIKDNLSVLLGPNFAHEIARGKITGTTVAAHNYETAEMIKDAFGNDRFWVDVYHGDPFDIEIVSAFKNVVGLVMGFSRTLPDYGENTEAFILQKGLLEARVLCQAMGGNFQAIMELAGFGDYALSMKGFSSRNVEAGYRFGMGELTVDDLKDSKQTLEGVRAVRIIRELSRQLRIMMPITRGVDQVLYHGAKPSRIVECLLSPKGINARIIANLGRRENGKV